MQKSQKIENILYNYLQDSDFVFNGDLEML